MTWPCCISSELRIEQLFSRAEAIIKLSQKEKLYLSFTSIAFKEVAKSIVWMFKLVLKNSRFFLIRVRGMGKVPLYYYIASAPFPILILQAPYQFYLCL